MNRISWALVALALIACSDKKSAAAADQSGNQNPPGGKPSVSNGAEGSVGDGGVIADGEAATSICPPTGLFKRTAETLDGMSDPRCRLSDNSAAKVFLGPITALHTAPFENATCSFIPDMVSEDGCDRQRKVTCDDGTSQDIQCDAQDGGTVRCTEQGEVTSMSCTVISEYTPDPNWKGRCDGLWGPYTRTSTQTGVGADCPDNPAEAEITDLAKLAIEPGCMLEFPTPNGSCTVTARESCDGGMGATHTCKVSVDSSVVTCTVTRGDCVYEVSLVR